jgi:hypothetical protein
MEPHPIRLVVEDDLRRSRLTVFLRIILAIPHLLWATLWSIGVFFVAILNWVMTLARGRSPDSLHKFMSAYIRYLAHLNAYLWLAANPWPGFVGEEGAYPIDVVLPAAQQQPRLHVAFRIILALPAVLLGATLGGGAGGFRVPTSGGARGGYSSGLSLGGLSTVSSVLGWFASVAQGRMPKGLRDASAYSVGYSAQTLAYLLLVTDRYPNSDPTQMLETVERPPFHPVHLVGDAHDLRRSRMLVLFRLPLAVPHIIWALLWAVVAVVVVFLNWFVVLFRGRPADPFHRFVTRFVRYLLHVYAFLFLVANPFPGFVGEQGRYPLDVELPGPAAQNRAVTAFRIILAVPALLVSSALGGALYVTAILTWFVALARGTAPWGLRNLAAYALRYQAQVNAYTLLLTDRYPHASPLEGAQPAQQSFDFDEH